MTVSRVCVEVVPGAASSPCPLPHLVQVLGTRLGPIFFCCFHFLPGSLRFNFLINTKGVERTPWVSPFVGERDSSSSSPGEGKTAPEVVTPVPQPSQSPPPLLLHYRRPLL